MKKKKLAENHSSKIGIQIAKTIAKTKIEAQASLLEKREIDSGKRRKRALEMVDKLEANSVD